MSRGNRAAQMRRWRAKNRKRYNACARIYQHARRLGNWPIGEKGFRWERIFVNALRDVLGLEPLFSE